MSLHLSEIKIAFRDANETMASFCFTDVGCYTVNCSWNNDKVLFCGNSRLSTQQDEKLFQEIKILAHHMAGDGKEMWSLKI